MIILNKQHLPYYRQRIGYALYLLIIWSHLDARVQDTGECLW